MSCAPIRLFINGDTRELPAPLDVVGLLTHEGLLGRRVAVEVNGEIVPRSRHAGFAVREGDRVEIVQALGGG